MLSLANRSELGRLSNCVELWSELSLDEDDPKLKLLKKNLKDSVAYFESQQRSIKVGDYSVRFLTESFMPGAAKVIMNFQLEEYKLKALNLTEAQLTQSIARELEAYSTDLSSGQLTVSPYQFSSLLETAINQVGKPNNAKDYLTYRLASVGAKWAAKNVFRIESIAENVGYLGQQIVINMAEFNEFKSETDADIISLQTELGGTEGVIKQQQLALTEVRSTLKDFANYVETEILEIDDSLARETKERIESNQQLMNQVEIIREALKIDREREATEEGFNGIKQTGHFVSHLGSLTDSKFLKNAGQVISSGAQVLQGMSQLTGTLIPSLAIMGPVSGIAMGALGLYSLFLGKKGSGDPAIAYMQKLSERMDEQFDAISKQLTEGFSTIYSIVQESEKHIIEAILASQKMTINQVRTICYATTQQLSKKFERGFNTLLKTLRFVHKDIDTKLYALLIGEFDAIVQGIEDHDYESDYFQKMESNILWHIRFNILTHWAINGAKHPAHTGYHLIAPIRDLEVSKRVEYNRSIQDDEQSFMIGYLLDNKNIANPNIWIRAVQAYIKLVIARPDYFSNLRSLDIEVTRLKRSGKKIVQHINDTFESLAKEKTYHNLLAEEGMDENFSNYFLDHLMIRFETLVEKRIPKTELDRAKWLASHLTIKYLKNSDPAGHVIKEWNGKHIDFSWADSRYEVLKKLPYGFGRTFIRLESSFFNSQWSLHSMKMLLLLDIINPDFTNFNIEITYTSRPGKYIADVKLFINEIETVFKESFPINFPYYSLGGDIPMFYRIKESAGFMFKLNQYFCRWFNAHTRYSLRDLLSIEDDIELYEYPALSIEDKQCLEENKSAVKRLFTENCYVRRLKSCFTYVPQNFLMDHYSEVTLLIEKWRTKLKPIKTSDDKAQFIVTGELLSEEDEFFKISNDEWGEGENDFLEAVSNFYWIYTSSFTEGILTHLSNKLLNPKSKGITIAQEIEHTLLLLEQIPQYVAQRLTVTNPQLEKSFSEVEDGLKSFWRDKEDISSAGWKIQINKGEKSGFYTAIIQQMAALNQPIVNGENLRERDTIRISEIFSIASKLNVIIGIVNMNSYSSGFRCYFVHHNGKVGSVIDPAKLPKNKPILRLAFTGHRYMSVQAHPELAEGAIRRKFEDQSFILSCSLSSLWSEINAVPTNYKDNNSIPLTHGRN